MSVRLSKTLGLATACLLLVLVAGSSAESVQRGNLRVSFLGKLSPNTLPRHGAAALSVTIGGRVKTTDGSTPPQLRGIELAINRHGRIDYRGLPLCRLEDIQPSSSRKALQACGSAKVGEGRFFADVAIPGQAPFPSRGRLIAFNGVEDGRHVIFAHVYGTDPLPTSYTVPFAIGRAKGTFATTLTASLPRVTGEAGFITGMTLQLGRSFRFRGERRSYLTASCPAPEGFNVAPFGFVRASFSFANRTLSSVLRRTCRARG